MFGRLQVAGGAADETPVETHMSRQEDSLRWDTVPVVSNKWEDYFPDQDWPSGDLT